MKKISLVLISLFVVLGFAGSALAVSIIQLGTKYSGNDVGESFILNTKSNIKIALNATPYNFDIDTNNIGYIGKTDENFNYGTFSGKNSTSGTWSLNGDYSKDVVYFYSIKAGNKYELYWIPLGAKAGDTINWNLNNITNGMSHIAFWTTTTPPPPPNTVPIPASVFLLAPALFGVVALSRRRKSYGRTNH